MYLCEKPSSLHSPPKRRVCATCATKPASRLVRPSWSRRIRSGSALANWCSQARLESCERWPVSSDTTPMQHSGVRRRRSDGYRLLSHLHFPWQERGGCGVSPSAVGVVILDFVDCVFTCSTQLVPIHAVLSYPAASKSTFNCPAAYSSIAVLTCSAGASASKRAPVCDQYTIQGDEFSRAIQDEHQVPSLARKRDREYGRDRSRVPVGRVGWKCLKVFPRKSSWRRRLLNF